MSRIKDIRARQIFDSRGRPTIEADVVLTDGSFGRAGVPAGASTGKSEARELRDGDVSAYDGFGVSRAVAGVNSEIARSLRGVSALGQRAIDDLLVGLDGTEDRSRLGANAILGVSLAVCRASAGSLGMPLYARIADLSETESISLPLPMVNILSGGLHAGRGMDVQDFLFIPAAAGSMQEAVEQVARVRSAAHKLAAEKNMSILLADEGGLGPSFKTSAQALEFMVEIFACAGLKPGKDALIAIDAAASSLQTENGNYYFPREGREYTAAEIVETVKNWSENFPVVSVEDALAEEDWNNWKLLNASVGDKIQIVGDDLFTTDPRRVERGIAERAANSVLIKPNQNGTLTGTLDVIKMAKENGLATVVSARSGETGDSFIADLAVGTNAGQIKIGSFRNAERLTKYNQLLRIEEETGAPMRAQRLPWEKQA